MTRVYESEGVLIMKDDEARFNDERKRLECKYTIIRCGEEIDHEWSFEEAYPLAQYYIKEKKNG